MAGRTRLPLKGGRYGGIVYLPCNRGKRFRPGAAELHVDLVYLSALANNPTGNRDGPRAFETMGRLREKT